MIVPIAIIILYTLALSYFITMAYSQLKELNRIMLEMLGEEE
jgi:hypothetical protein